jgi:sporulation related protein
MTTDIERSGIDVGGSHEPSYYEIALTNRQVVVAFVILLTCVVAAFFSGVWIGRESAARAQERLALLGRGGVLDGANPDADKGKQEGQALQEFKFFADSRHHPAAARDHPAAKGDAGSRSGRSTLADDLRRSAGDSAPAAPAGNATSSVAPRAAAGTAAAPPSSAAKRPQRDSAASSPPQAAKAGKANSAPAATPAGPAGETAGEGEPLPGTPQPAARAARSPRANASSGTGAASAGGGKSSISWSAAAGTAPAGVGALPSGATASAAAGEVVIQVFSTADKEQADKVRDGLVDAGFTAFLSPIAKGGQTMYRVRIGPFPSRTAAEPVAEKVRKERKLDTWITPK